MKRWLSILLFCICTPVYAQFDLADEFFQNREDNDDAVQAGKTEYQNLIQQLDGPSQAYAVQQFSQLVLYEATCINTTDRVYLTKIAQACREAAATLGEDEDSITVESYFRMACTSLWLKNATLADRLRELPVIKADFNRLIDENLEIRTDTGIDLRYWGGGLYRVLALIYANSLSSNLRAGLPNVDKAIEFSTRAIRSRPFPGSPVSGADYYSNHLVKIESLKADGQYSAANQLIASTVEEIHERRDDDDMPEGLEPETRCGLRALEDM